MPSQQLLLSWKDHNGALVSVFENLLKRNTLVDCTLAADGQYLKAHKVVLSACSSYFELLFSQESEKNPIVILKDVKFQELEAAVNFMYRGEVEVCEDRLAAFLEVADSLQIKGLGSDGKSQDYKGKSPPLKSSKTAAPPKQHSRKEAANTHSENTGESSITLDSDQNSNNESSSHHQQPHRETSGSSPIPSTLAIASSFSIASASTSCPVRPETHGDQDKLENNQCSSPTVSTFPSGETVPSDVNTVIKTEPVTDTYLDEKSDETERDFDDVTMMEDQEDWDDPNIESMGDDHANQHDPDYSATHMKTEESASENMAGAPSVEHVSSEGTGRIQSERVVVGKEEEEATAAADVEEEDDEESEEEEEETEAASAEVEKQQQRRRRQLQQQQQRRQKRARQTRKRSPPAPPVSHTRPAKHAARSPADKRRASEAAAVAAPRKLACLMCGAAAAAFDTAAQLRDHYATHTEQRPFKCEECEYAAMQASDLRKHQRIHTGERPYTCGECGVAFTQSNSLRVHERIHTGERPFRCADCDKAFTAKGHLVAHRRKHHDLAQANADF